MSKKHRVKKKFNLKGRKIADAQHHARKFLISAVQDMKDAVFITDENLADVILSYPIAQAINKVKHEWSFCFCVAGRYKNGKVWINYLPQFANMHCLAEEVSPLVTEGLDRFWEEQDPKTRICKWWVARPIPDHEFTSFEVVLPAYKADIFRGFINSYENMGNKVSSNYPPKGPKEMDLIEWSDWYHENVSPRSKLKTIYVSG